MVAYTAAAGDVESGEKTAAEARRSSSGPMWKILVSVLSVALCLGGALIFFSLWSGRPELMGKMSQSDARKETDHHFTLRQISTTAKAAIHLEVSYDKDKDQLLWKNGQGQAFAQGDLDLKDNKIVVPRKGLYFVYSQASFRALCGEDADAHSLKSLSHRIWRHSDMVGGSSTLMGAVRSACQRGSQESGWYNTVYLGAVFQLNRGDTLWTETNHLSEVETEEGKTFFGVFALQ